MALIHRHSLSSQPRPEKHTIPNRFDREKRTVEWPVEYACLGKTWITAKYPCFRMRKGPKKMNKIYEFIFSSRRRTKKMDNGQLFMFTRKKDGQHSSHATKSPPSKTLKGREFLLTYSLPCSFSLPRKYGIWTRHHSQSWWTFSPQKSIQAGILLKRSASSIFFVSLMLTSSQLP